MPRAELRYGPTASLDHSARRWSRSPEYYPRYPPTRCYGMSGTAVAYGRRLVLPPLSCYAMLGTNLVYRAEVWLCGDWY
eukprot:605920-Rhodomonas_salina.3